MRASFRVGGLVVMACAGFASVAAKPPLALPVAVGPAIACIPLRNIRSTSVVDDRTIDFHVSGRKVYRNTLPFRCPQLGFQQAFSYATSQSQLCSLDIITVFVQGSPGLQGASCGLGRFTPIAPVPR